jgi:lipoic acid synthetase
MAVPVSLVQLTRSVAATAAAGPAPARKPGWLKVKAPGGPNYAHIKNMMRELGLHTVCEEARCPNIGECWEHKAATFMILGDVCTRNCTYCAVAHGTPTAFDPLEPVRLADAVERMGLSHVVITSVDRDDLPNGGAEAFAGCITEIRRRLPDTSVEVLIPDFKGSEQALRIVMDARPDILNHNLETAERLYRLARPGGRYDRALALLANARRMDAAGLTKSGIILGMGEEWDEVLVCMRDLRRSDVNILTLGQYLRPSDGHLPVARYYTPAEFAELRDLGLAMGFSHIQASPLTRSSYHAWEQVVAAKAVDHPEPLAHPQGGLREGPPTGRLPEAGEAPPRSPEPPARGLR